MGSPSWLKPRCTPRRELGRRSVHELVWVTASGWIMSVDSAELLARCGSDSPAEMYTFALSYLPAVVPGRLQVRRPPQERKTTHDCMTAFPNTRKQLMGGVKDTGDPSQRSCCWNHNTVVKVRLRRALDKRRELFHAIVRHVVQRHTCASMMVWCHVSVRQCLTRQERLLWWPMLRSHQSRVFRIVWTQPASHACSSGQRFRRTEQRCRCGNVWTRTDAGMDDVVMLANPGFRCNRASQRRNRMSIFSANNRRTRHNMMVCMRRLKEN